MKAQKLTVFLLLSVMLLSSSACGGGGESATICVDSPSLNFTAVEGGSNPAGKTLGISNCGGRTLDWSVISDAAWLTLSPTKGTCTEETDNVTVSANISGMTAGSHSTVITIWGEEAGNTPQMVSVSLTISPAPTPTISYTPVSFTFTATEGGSNPSSQILRISNSGGGTLSWSVSDNAAWLTLSPTKGTCAEVTDNVTVSANISGINAGNYSATITVSAPGATNTPQIVSVSLTINPPQITRVQTEWDVHWSTLTGEGEWGAEVGTETFPSTFDYNWSTGDVFAVYSNYIGFSAYAEIKMQRDSGGPVTFTIGSDDGSQLYLDGSKIIDNWGGHSYRTRSVTVNLTPGKHDLRLRYYEWTTYARVSFDCDPDVLEWEEVVYP